MVFDKDGKANITLKAGESKTAIFPAQGENNFEHMSYTVEEVLTSGDDGQEVDYSTKTQQNGGEAAVTNTVRGELGEMLGEIENSSGLSDIVFTNTRVTGDLTVSKTVVSSVDSDLEGNFAFTLNLDDTSDNRISKDYTTTLTTKDSSAGNETSVRGSITFTNGVATFALKNNQALTVHDLPTDLPYTVTENLTEEQSAKIRTQVKKDDSKQSYSTIQTGKIGEAPTDVTDGEGEEMNVNASSAGSVDALRMPVATATVRLSGAGVCKAYVKEALEVQCTGASTCSYKTDGEIKLDLKEIARTATLKKL